MIMINMINDNLVIKKKKTTKEKKNKKNVWKKKLQNAND